MLYASAILQKNSDACGSISRAAMISVVKNGGEILLTTGTVVSRNNEGYYLNSTEGGT